MNLQGLVNSSRKLLSLPLSRLSSSGEWGFWFEYWFVLSVL